MTEPAKKRISGAWYALVVLPWIVGIAVWYVHLPKLIAGFTDLGQQSFAAVEAPGDVAETMIFSDSERHAVTLRAGENTIYVEGDASGTSARARAQLACVLYDGSDRVQLERDSSTTMTLNADSYVSQYTVQIQRAGDYQVACGASSAVRFSIGHSFSFLSIVWLILSVVLALPMTGIIGYLVNRARNPRPPKTPPAPVIHRAV